VEPSRDPHLPRPTLPDHISQRSSSPSEANRGGDRQLVRSQSTRHYTISVLPVSRKRMPALTQGRWCDSAHRTERVPEGSPAQAAAKSRRGSRCRGPPGKREDCTQSAGGIPALQFAIVVTSRLAAQIWAIRGRAVPINEHRGRPECPQMGMPPKFTLPPL